MYVHMFFSFFCLCLSTDKYARARAVRNDMTLEEKIGQMIMIDGRNDLEKQMEQCPGWTLFLLGDDAAKAIDLNRQKCPKAPLLLGIDAIHGHGFWSGATVYPTELAVAATFDEEMAYQLGNLTANEMRYTGVSWTCSPVLCISRDLRWGRVGETMGEDQRLIARLGRQITRGYQDNNVMPTLKHYIGYGETQGGRDATESDLSKRKLRSYFFEPFEESVKQGAVSVMAAYQAIDGVPVVMNKYLLTDILRGEWGFDGIVMTDWNGVGQLVTGQKVAATLEDAVVAAVNAGVDVFMTTDGIFEATLSAVKNGRIPESAIDAAVDRILKIKTDLGLFEDERYPDLSKVQVATEDLKAKALKAAEEAIVMVKNDGTLPVAQSAIKTIAVLGPNADHPIAQNGDWSLGSNAPGEHPRECTTTILDGIKEMFPNANVVYEKGARIEEGEEYDLDKAIEAAKNADLIVVVVGDRPPFWGEFHSTATMELLGTQKELLTAIAGLKKKFVLNVLASKALIIPDEIVEAANTIFFQFCPGMLGGKAFAEVLVGDVNPSGRLPISIPYHVGQLPIFYNEVRGQHGNEYADMVEAARWPFGHGLSYSTFKYTSAKLDKKTYTKDDDIKVTLTVSNRGDYDGACVVQFYLYDLVTSATWAVQELKEFKRVWLKKGESQQITVTIKASDCSIVNAAGQRVVEPGQFEIRVSDSATNYYHKLKFTIE